MAFNFIGLVAEDLSERVAAGLDPQQADAERDRAVADQVERGLLLDEDVEVAAPGDHGERRRRSGGRELLVPVGHLDRDVSGDARRGGRGRRAHEAAGVDDDDVVADPLDLAEEVRRTRTEIPNSRPILAMSPSISSRPAGSRPFVGSSRSSSSGSWTSAWASFTRCFMPVE